MNDYLDSLVERTFHPDESFQPRLPGLFEPSTSDPDLTGGFLAESERNYQPVETRHESPLTPMTTPESARMPGEGPNQPYPPPSEQVILPLPVQPLVPPFDAPQDTIPSNEPATSVPTTLIPIPSYPSNERARSVNVSHQVLPSLEPPGETRVSSPVPSLPTRSAQQPASIGGAPVLGVQIAAESSNTSAPMEPAATFLPVTVPAKTEMPEIAPSEAKTLLVPQAQPFSAQASDLADSKPPSGRSTTTPAPPTIEVTIGRIEVRATPPALTARKPASSTPRLTLDEYLRQRQAGSR